LARRRPEGFLLFVVFTGFVLPLCTLFHATHLETFSDRTRRICYDPAKLNWATIMELRIKLRHRALPPKPWKWEIYSDRLITASREAYASQHEAHRAARPVLKALLGQFKIDPVED
jgi:hypothetical protein